MKSSVLNTINFKHPSLSHWEEKMKETARENSNPKFQKALNIFCNYLTTREPFTPESAKGEKIIEIIGILSKHPEPQMYINAFILINKYQENFTMQERKILSEKLLTHVQPMLFANALVFFAEKKLIFVPDNALSQENLTRLIDKVDYWFDDTSVTRLLNQLSDKLFPQDFFDSLIATPKKTEIITLLSMRISISSYVASRQNKSSPSEIEESQEMTITVSGPV